MSKTTIVRLRVEPKFKQQLQNAINQGHAKNMSDLIRKAVNQLLNEAPEK